MFDPAEPATTIVSLNPVAVTCTTSVPVPLLIVRDSIELNSTGLLPFSCNSPPSFTAGWYVIASFVPAADSKTVKLSEPPSPDNDNDSVPL